MLVSILVYLSLLIASHKFFPFFLHLYNLSLTVHSSRHLMHFLELFLFISPWKYIMLWVLISAEALLMSNHTIGFHGGISKNLNGHTSDQELHVCLLQSTCGGTSDF